MIVKNKQQLIVYFDRIPIGITQSGLEKFITDEMNRLSTTTGYSITNLSLEFSDEAMEKTIACFQYDDNLPRKSIGFCFFLQNLDGLSANKIVDTCRHEFAHYIVCEQGIVEEDDHGPYWQKVCKRLNAIPSACKDISLTKHFSN